MLSWIPIDDATLQLVSRYYRYKMPRFEEQKIHIVSVSSKNCLMALVVEQRAKGERLSHLLEGFHCSKHTFLIFPFRDYHR